MTLARVLPVLDVTEYRLQFARSLAPADTVKLRGFFGEVYADESDLHHHNPDGSLRYVYPTVQFKVLDRLACLIGVGKGGELVARLWAEVDRARLGAEELPVLEASLQRRRASFGELEAPVSYRFRSPWLGLNQNNHSLYQAWTSPRRRQGLLEKILCGNCLSVAKAFDHHVQMLLKADASDLQPVETRLKGVKMLGFLGTFRINFALPDRIGIGKSVSRGFGTLEGVPEKKGR
jgi:hypothetical protein